MSASADHCCRSVVANVQTRLVGWRYCSTGSVLLPRHHHHSARVRRPVAQRMLQRNPARGWGCPGLRCHLPTARSHYCAAANGYIGIGYIGPWRDCQCSRGLPLGSSATCRQGCSVGVPEGQSNRDQSRGWHAGLRRRQVPLDHSAGVRRRPSRIDRERRPRAGGYPSRFQAGRSAASSSAGLYSYYHPT